MKSRTSHPLKKLPTDFIGLNAMHELRPINDDIDLENAHEVMDRLAVLTKRSKDQNDYLETLVLITEAYDKENNESALKAASRVSGVEMLRYLMGNVEMTQAELAKLLGIGPSAMSMILSGERPITADHARAMSRRFKVDAGVFLRA